MGVGWWLGPGGQTAQRSYWEVGVPPHRGELLAGSHAAGIQEGTAINAADLETLGAPAGKPRVR